MEVVAVETSPDGVEADVLALALTEPPEPGLAVQALDLRFAGRLTRLVADGELTGARGRVTLVHTSGEVAAPRLALAGLGPRAEADADALRSAAASVVTSPGGDRVRTVAWLLDEDGLPAPEQGSAVADGLALGRHDEGRWKTGAERPPAVERLLLCGPQAGAALDEARRAALVAGWTNRCRDLVNAPANALTPQRLAEVAGEVAERFPTVKARVLGPDKLERAGMGSLLAVAQGSHNPPRLVTLRYEPEAPADPDLVLGLVGKGITFDSGGLSLKTAEAMEDMKSDMAGAAAAISGLAAIAELGLPVRTIVVVPACENMPAGHATRPGDVVRAADGTTIEVNNTDAEGRLVLADALLHARDEGATHVLDLATLTGAIQVALGDFYAGLFGNDDAWIERVRAAGEASGDHAWPLPLHRSYERFLDSRIADMRNSPERKRGSAIIGAGFLRRFAGDEPWAHLDIGGTAYLERARDYYPQPGATGYGVRLVAQLAASLSAAG
jgi:leucyl aminopeptidase